MTCNRNTTPHTEGVLPAKITIDERFASTSPPLELTLFNLNRGGWVIAGAHGIRAVTRDEFVEIPELPTAAEKSAPRRSAAAPQA